MSDTTLYYVHDPMCSWCWGFKNTWADVQRQLPDNITVNNLLGGLAPDSEIAMPEEMQINIRDTWRSIQKQIPDTEFNFDFWTLCNPRRSTYPACRAVIAARKQNDDTNMVLAIQQAYYLQAKNPSDDAVLLSIADELGLDIKEFTSDLNSADTNAELQNEIRFSRTLGVKSFPALVLSKNKNVKRIQLDYNNPAVILNQIFMLDNS